MSEGATFRFKLSHPKYVTKPVLYKIVIAVGTPLGECMKMVWTKIHDFLGMDLEHRYPE